MSAFAIMMTPTQGLAQGTSFAGQLDPTFGDNGKVLTESQVGKFTIYDVAIQDDGRIIVVGYFNESPYPYKNLAVRYQSNGEIDTSFGSEGFFIDSVVGECAAYAVAIQPDGFILIGGVCNNDLSLARLTPNGLLDNSFGDDGYIVHSEISDGEIKSIVLQPDGKIIAAGVTGQSFFVGRYLSNGTLDTSFGEIGYVTADLSENYNDEGEDLVVTETGGIIVAGWSNNPISNTDFALVGYDPNGNLDEDFGSNGIVFQDINGLADTALSIVQQPDRKLIAGGFSSAFNSSNFSFSLARFDPDGSLDTNYGEGGIVLAKLNLYNNHCEDTLLQFDNKLIAVGWTYYDFLIGRFKTDGSLDVTFGDDGWVVTDFDSSSDKAYAVALQNDGKIVVAGTSADSIALARYEWLVEPQDEIQNLQGQVNLLVDSGELNEGVANSLLVKLDAAIRSLDKDHPNAAIGQLEAFINEVEAAMLSDDLNTQEGEYLIAVAQTLVNYIEE